ncbi:MAG: hypothetical protein ICV79_01620 [Flavisolibacter sp.]|nr:hypothetical protein [Flavisolibacter sp.]
MPGKIAMVSLFALFALLISCTRHAEETNNTSTVSNGSWRVNHYMEKGIDETGDFSGYTFTFSANGVATATKGSINKNGTWSISSNKFNLNMGTNDNTNKPFGKLTDDWIITTINETVISLLDDNPARDGMLIFTRD